MKRKIYQKNPISSPSPSPSPVVPGNYESSAEIVASIKDLVNQILLKLPIKSLIQFKLVCKPWLSLISNPRFVPNSIRVRGIFFGYKSEFQFIPLNPNKNPISLESPPFRLIDDKEPNPIARMHIASRSINQCPHILHSCNGLIVYSSSIFSGSHGYGTIYVYNPTTDSTIYLGQDLTISRLGTYIVFEPAKSQHFKVVTVMLHRGVYTKEEWKHRVRIYSSETDAWSSGGAITTGKNPRFRFDMGVYCNGSIHWICSDQSRKGLRFHVDTLALAEMPSRPPVTLENDEGILWYFGESCGHLHFAECALPQFNIYEMASDYSQWFVKYKVDLSNLISEYPEVERMTKPGTYITYILSLIREMNDEADSFIVLRTPDKAIKCNLADGRLEKLCDFNKDIPRDYFQCHHGSLMGFDGGYAVEYIPCLTMKLKE